MSDANADAKSSFISRAIRFLSKRLLKNKKSNKTITKKSSSGEIINKNSELKTREMRRLSDMEFYNRTSFSSSSINVNANLNTKVV